MTTEHKNIAIDPNTFNIETLEDEIQADRCCTELLKNFAASLARDKDVSPIEAGRFAHGADPFLRDFMVANRRENIFNPSPGRVRQYAGHFYVINALEPNLRELESILEGVHEFYRYAHELGFISASTLELIQGECSAIEDYARRIDEFWALEDDGFYAWREAIPLD